MQPRKVTIYSIENIEYNYPKVRFTAKVGSGTYIRSLAEDIGRELGVGAYMSNLRRTSVGDANLSQAYSVSDITDELLQKILAATE
jgi:tRNA pseudouridine55 synthase